MEYVDTGLKAGFTCATGLEDEHTRANSLLCGLCIW